MDLVERLVSGLEPLGGALHLDRFLELLAAARAREVEERAAAARRAAAAAAREPKEPPEAESPAGGGAGEAPAARDPLEPRGVEMEIEDFLNRDAKEGTSDEEIQEFLKDRRGFDPDDLA